MRSRVLTAVAAAAMLGAVVAPAQAQVNYYTQGWFSSGTPTCNASAPVAGSPVSATCVTPSYTLSYVARASNPNLSLPAGWEAIPQIHLWKSVPSPLGYERTNRERMRQSDNSAWVARSFDPKPDPTRTPRRLRIAA